MEDIRLYKSYCPVCNQPLPGEYFEYENCGACGWEDETFCIEYPDAPSGANKGVSLNQAINNYKRTGKAKPSKGPVS